MPLQCGLGSLRVLEVVHCKGPLCIACALPALQASGRPNACMLCPVMLEMSGLLLKVHSQCMTAQIDLSCLPRGPKLAGKWYEAAALNAGHITICAMLTWTVVMCMQRIAFTACRHLRLLPALQSALQLQLDTRCELTEAWFSVCVSLVIGINTLMPPAMYSKSATSEGLSSSTVIASWGWGQAYVAVCL